MLIAITKGCLYVGVALLLGAGVAVLPSTPSQAEFGDETFSIACPLEATQGAQAPQPKFDLPVSGKAGPGL